MRINLFGGASVGKSATASLIFAKLKQKGFSVELPPEKIKPWVYTGRIPNVWDQFHIFGKQLQAETNFLVNGYVKHIVCECPLFLSACYQEYNNGKDYADPLFDIEELYSEQYGEINIFLKRNVSFYKEEGRFHSLAESKIIDKFILSKLKDFGKTYTEFYPTEEHEILKYIIAKL